MQEIDIPLALFPVLRMLGFIPHVPLLVDPPFHQCTLRYTHWQRLVGGRAGINRLGMTEVGMYAVTFSVGGNR